MKVYGQLVHESGSWAQPQADDYIQFDSLSEAKRTLARCWDGIDAGEGVTLVLVRGVPDPDDPYPCDFSAHSPDYVYRLGPRGGVQREL